MQGFDSVVVDSEDGDGDRKPARCKARSAMRSA